MIKVNDAKDHWISYLNQLVDGIQSSYEVEDLHFVGLEHRHQCVHPQSSRCSHCGD